MLKTTTLRITLDAKDLTTSIMDFADEIRDNDFLIESAIYDEKSHTLLITQEE